MDDEFEGTWKEMVVVYFKLRTLNLSTDLYKALCYKREGRGFDTQ
jgi:hypothetical protein